MADITQLPRSASNCPVCLATNCKPLITIDAKPYWACINCQAYFLDPSELPTRQQERAHYALHQNDPSDPAYRAFLSKLTNPLLAKLPANQRILDYGAGPGPALAAMLSEVGHDVTLYDPVFAPDQTALKSQYDAVTCTETAEHFHNPASEFARLADLLRPGGWLGIMTCFQPRSIAFADWYYRKDPTHVVFYCEKTFEVLGAQLGMTFESPAENVALMQKPPT